MYPPCDTTAHRQLGLQAPRQRCVLSLGQFRPEKDHVKQLYILRRLLDLGAPSRFSHAQTSASPTSDS